MQNEFDIPTNSPLADEELQHVTERIESICANAIEKFLPTNKLGNNRIMLSTAVRALQAESKRVQRKLHSLGALAPRDQINSLRMRARLLRGMIVGHARREFARFLSEKYGAAKGLREAQWVVKHYTAHKSRPAINERKQGHRHRRRTGLGRGLRIAISKKSLGHHRLAVTT